MRLLTPDYLSLPLLFLPSADSLPPVTASAINTSSRRRVAEKGYNPDEESDARAEIPLFLGLANEDGYPHEGLLDFAESEVDTGTGTLELRGVLPNPGPAPAMLPGLFTRLRLPVDKRDNALLVTERAIGADQEEITEHHSVRLAVLARRPF